MKELKIKLFEGMRSVDLRIVVEGMRRLAEMKGGVFPSQGLAKATGSVVVKLRGCLEAERRFDACHSYYLRTLAKHGWYIPVWRNTPCAVIPPLVSLLKSGKAKEADEWLCGHFNELSGEIEMELSKLFPARAVILKKAFDAHRKGDFELSIPVLLAQADGIMIETVGKEGERYSVYSRGQRNIQTLRKLIEKIDTVRYEKEILEVALLEVPLNESEALKFALGEVLNRNAVHHGISTTYATGPNSCKAISWLQYVADFCEAKKYADQRKKLNDSRKPLWSKGQP